MPGENILLLQEMDNPDDRRELRRCLEQLNQAQRTVFAEWIIGVVNGRAEITKKGKIGLRLDSAIDIPQLLKLVMICIVYHGLTTREALEEAERRARSAVLIGTAGRFYTAPETAPDSSVLQNHRW